MAGIVLHCPLFGLGAERIGNPLGRPLVIGRERDPHMAIVEDRIGRAIGLFDLVQRLGDQEGLEAIACHIGERALEEVEPAEGREFVQHEQDPPAGCRLRHGHLRRQQPAGSQDIESQRLAAR